MRDLRSDVHGYGTGLYGKKGQIIGHEFSGEIVQVFISKLYGSCYWRKKQYILRPNLFKFSKGYGLPGALVEYILLRKI